MMKTRIGGALLFLGGLSLLGGCTAVIDQASFFPQLAEAPNASLAAPPGYEMAEAMLELPGLGQVHAVRLDNPASEATIVYHGGNGSFVSLLSRHAAGLADAAGADIILYDYPGRGGTSVPPTIEAAIETGPALLKALRGRGWIGAGPLFSYGLSFGGSQAAAMVREGGFAGLIIEASAADIAAVGRNFVPGLVRPFVRLRVDPALSRFDYLGYATATRTPVLLIASRDDKIVKMKNIEDFAAQLRARQTPVRMVVVPGRHGTALAQPDARAAIKAFVAERGQTSA
jgi:pimeloyl-ACP methyl ester carboxylesterase